MCRPRCINSATLSSCLTILILTAQVFPSSSRSLSAESESHNRVRRNAWWTKKSVDEGISQGSRWVAEHHRLNRLENAINCSARCNPDLVWCGEQSADQSQFYQCKLQYRMCTARCIKMAGNASLN